MKYDKTGSNLVDDTTVFISYSREDQDFVERLEQYLAGQSIKCFVDRTHIDKGEEWWGRIEQLISLSQKVIFVLSPDFLRSGVCKREVECAVTLNKKLLPIVYRNIDGQNVSEHLEKINYRFCDSKEISEAFTTKLVAAIHADIDWYREYERLAESARQWKKSKMATWNRLSGPAVLSAQRLIARRPVNSNPPDENTMEFVEFSHRVEVRRQRQAVAASISVAVVFMLLAVWAWLNMKETQFGQIRNIAAQAKTEAAAGKMHVPVALALEANAELKKQQWFGKLFEEWMPEFVAYAANRLSGISNPKEWFKAAKTSVGDALVDAVESAHRGALLTYMARANNTVDIRDDGSLVALAVEGNNVQLWASSGEGQPIVLSGHKDMISSVSFVCEGALVLTTSQDKTAKLWDAISGKLRNTYVGHEDHVLAASLDDTCTRLVTASADAAVRVWDVSSAETSNILQLHDEPVVYSRFGPRGEILVTASEDGTAIILDTNSGTPRKVIDGYKGGVVRAILNSKIEHHLTYDYDGKPRIVESPSEIRSSKWYANLEQIVADARELPFQCLNLDQRRRYGLPSTPQFTKNPDTYCKQNN